MLVARADDLREVGHSHHQLASYRQEVRTGGRRPHAARVTLEQAHLQQLLQVGERLGDRRLRHADRVRRALHAAEFGQCQDHLHVAEFAAGEQPVQEDGGAVRQDIGKSNG